jgi:hypothetical protein
VTGIKIDYAVRKSSGSGIVWITGLVVVSEKAGGNCKGSIP